MAAAASGKKWVTPAFIIQYMAVEPSAPPVIAYGLTASSKVGNAVIRNRCRRRLRALVAAVFPTQALPGFRYVLIARPTTAKHDYAAMKKDLLWALRKIGALRV